MLRPASVGWPPAEPAALAVVLRAREGRVGRVGVVLPTAPAALPAAARRRRGARVATVARGAVGEARGTSISTVKLPVATVPLRGESYAPLALRLIPPPIPVSPPMPSETCWNDSEAAPRRGPAGARARIAAAAARAAAATAERATGAEWQRGAPPPPTPRSSRSAA